MPSQPYVSQNLRSGASTDYRLPGTPGYTTAADPSVATTGAYGSLLPRPSTAAAAVAPRRGDPGDDPPGRKDPSQPPDDPGPTPLPGEPGAPGAPGGAGGGFPIPGGGGGGFWGKVGGWFGSNWGGLAKLGIGGVGSWLAGKKAQNDALKLTPEEQRAQTAAYGVGDTLAGQGKELYGLGLPYMRQAGDYYSTLLRGNRAAQSLAVAQPRAAISDVYRGAERSLERSNIRGGARDVAAGELARERAGKMAALTAGVQPSAAGALADLGGKAVTSGVTAGGQAGNIYDDMMRIGAARSMFAQQQGTEASKIWGSLLFQGLKDVTGK